MQAGYVPSFCTSCYRQGRTGEIFMEYAIPGFIQQFCTPNALVTLAEYLEDYASPATREVGRSLIAQELGKLDAPQAESARTALASVAQGRRDIIF
jgi:2-iminoacetate synthase